jgi:GcrA cell cycle regulator
MAQAGETWTAERLELLSKLRSEGLSASQIAAELGVTRSAVLGKCHRLGLARKASTKVSSPRSQQASRPLDPPATAEPAMEPGPKPLTNTARHQPAEQPRELSRPVEAGSLGPKGLTIMELREGTCRWPLGDPTTPEFRYCGGGAVLGLPYCAHHAQIAYQPSVERKRLRT